MPQPPGLHGYAVSSLLPAKDRFESWRVVQGISYTASLPEGLAAEQFHYEISYWRFDKFLLSQARFAPHLQVRTAKNIRTDHLDHTG